MAEINFIDELCTTAKELVTNGADAGPALRNLQRSLKKYIDTSETEEPNLTFLCFFLILIIDDLFYNLSGDFPYTEEYHEIINNIFITIGGALVELTPKLNITDFDNCYSIYVKIVQIYLNGLSDLQRLYKTD